MKPVRILVFAKAPLPGRVKTRLIPALGAEGAARLARRLLDLALARARAAAVGPVELCMSPGPGYPDWAGIPLPPDIDTRDQGDGDLGERMARAAKRHIDNGESVLLTGDGAGFDLFSFPSNARLAGFDLSASSIAWRAKPVAAGWRGGDVQPRAVRRTGGGPAGRAHGLAGHAGECGAGLPAQAACPPGAAGGGAGSERALLQPMPARYGEPIPEGIDLPDLRQAGEGGFLGAGAHRAQPRRTACR
jgi:hypothetical protein